MAKRDLVIYLCDRANTELGKPACRWYLERDRKCDMPAGTHYPAWSLSCEPGVQLFERSGLCWGDRLVIEFVRTNAEMCRLIEAMIEGIRAQAARAAVGRLNKESD